MQIVMEQRPSDSPYIERVWRSQSDDINTFISAAVVQWELVVWTQEGCTYASVQGPATQASRAPVPQHAEFFGIVFRSGSFMAKLAGHALVNRSVPLAGATKQRLWFLGASYEMPTFDNAECFVKRLAQERVIERDPVIESTLSGAMPKLSRRTVQRRFLYTAGLSYRTIRQIERARRASLLLQNGMSILDTVFEMGYTDQPHLTKSLQHFIGQTPVQLATPHRGEQLSLLYKTDFIADPKIRVSI